MAKDSSELKIPQTTPEDTGWLISEELVIRDTSKILEKRFGGKIKFQGKLISEQIEDNSLFKVEVSKLHNRVAYILFYPVGLACGQQQPTLQKCREYLTKCLDMKFEFQPKMNECSRTFKPPTFYLNVTVIEARGLEAKDIDGFSDPYCILGIIPGGSQINSEIMECGAMTAADSEISLQVKPSNRIAVSEGPKRNTSTRFGQSFRRRIMANNGTSGTNSKSLEVSIPTHLTCLKDSQIPVKLMRSTSVKENTLNPVWNEKFQFELDDVSTDWFHLDIWDHDEETSVLDAVRSLNEVKGVKQLGRYFKQVGQSARKGQSGDLDDFLGCITMAVKEIPPTGMDNWFDLVGRSAKSKVQGSIRLMFRVTTVSDEDELRGPNMSDIRMHIRLIYSFINYELNHSKKPSTEWSGCLAPEAEFILFQHAEHFGLGPVHTAMCRWICLAKKYRRRPIQCRLLDEQLKALLATWTDKSLSHDQLELLGNSFKGFTEHATTLISQCQVVFSHDHPESLQHLECLLSCLRELHQSRLFQFCSPFGNTLQSELTNAFKKRAVTNYKLMRPTVAELDEYGSHPFSSSEMLSCVVLLTNLNEELDVISRIYNPLCLRHAGVDIFAILCKTYADLVFRDYVNNSKISNLVKITSTSTGQCTPSTNIIGSRSPYSVKQMRELFVLYRCLQDFWRVVSANAKTDDEETKLPIDWYTWFEPVLSDWVSRCSSTLLWLIEKALQTDNITSTGIHHFGKTMTRKNTGTTSSIDVSDEPVLSESAKISLRALNNALHIWKLCDWPDPATRAVYASVVVQAVCEAALLYVKMLHEKLRLKGYCDEQGQFDISYQLCIGLNNLDSVIQCVTQIPEILEWIKPSPDCCHNSPVESNTTPSEGQIIVHREESEPQLENLQRILHEGLTNIYSVFDRLFSRIRAKMRPEIRKNVFHLCWCANKTPTEKAIYDLIVYLESNFKTLRNLVSDRLLRRFIFELWSECLSQFVEQAHKEAEIGPNGSGPGAYLMPSLDASTPGRCIIPLATHFTNDDHMSALPEHITHESILRARSVLMKLKQALELLLQFFLKTGQGQVDRNDLDDQNFKDVHYLIQLYISSTPELIELYLLEKIREQESVVSTPFGTLKVNVVWQNNKLLVDVISASGLTPLDSNGLSDPFVIVDLLPTHIFGTSSKQARTRVIKNNLDPVFNERFEFSVTSDEMHHPAACVVFVVMDRDLLLSDDLEGTAFLSLESLNEADSSTRNEYAQNIRRVHRNLRIFHPIHKKHSALEILGKRTDANAQEVFKRWHEFDKQKDPF
ncbi:hypothetical protein D915_001132 [Fasciola hepatica]|uniref:Uncharacterized protein n=1 Tax=Fasciola hepatica TaxID=6192 RepID=A0A4E0RXH7_FASHE|nr:hypothetical protein D915_001132 [Fasciola hepatica]